MSTVIYTAYRLKKGKDPSDFAAHIRERVLPEAKRRIRLLIRSVMEANINPEARAETWRELEQLRFRLNGSPPRDLGALELEKPMTPIHADTLLNARYLAQLPRQQRNDYDMDVFLNVWKTGGRYLVTPREDRVTLLSSGMRYGLPEWRPLLGWLARDKAWVEPYAYWNNVDRPEGISQVAWDRRGYVWRAAMESGTYTCIPVVDRAEWDRIRAHLVFGPNREVRRDWLRVAEQYPEELLVKHQVRPVKKEGA